MSRSATSSDISSRGIKCCVGSGPTDVAPVARRFDTFSEFADFVLQEAGRSGKKGGRYVCGPLDPKEPNDKGSIRNKHAALPRTWTAADIDGCAPDESRALIKWAKRWRGFAYGTSRDSADSRRFRLVWELAGRVDRAAGTALGRWIEVEIAKIAPSAKVDPSAFRGEQPIYLPLSDAWSMRWDDAEPMPLRIDVPAISERDDEDVLRSIDARPVEGMTIEHAADLLAHLPDHWGTPESGTWFKVAAALHLQFDGSGEAYRVLDEWSSTREGYDPRGNEARWATGFTHEGKVLTMRGLAHEAEQNGWQWPAVLRKVATPDALSAKENADWLLSDRRWKYLHYTPMQGSSQRVLRVFTGKVWEHGDDCKELKLDMADVKSHWNRLAAEAKRTGDTSLAKKLTAWAHKCDERSVIEQTCWHLARAPEIETSLDAFDKNPSLLSVANGVLDLDTGKLLKHSPEQMLTNYVDINYDAKATAPLWWKLILDASDGDFEWCDFVQRWFGYAVSGHTSEQVMLFLTGLPNSGKTTLVETVCAVLGKVHTVRLSTTSIRVNRYGEPYDLARLPGKRIAVVPEITRNDEIDVELLKRISGEDTMTVRMIREAPVEFLSCAKLLLAGNSLPAVDPDHEAFWRRVLVVPFDHAVPPDKRDTKLKQRLLREAPGILAWLAQGYRRWKREPLKVALPARIRAAVAEYRAKHDPNESWYAECTEPNGETQAKKLYDHYVHWYGQNLERFGLDIAEDKPLTQTAFGLWLGGKGHTSVKRAAFYVRSSIQLRSSTA